MTEQPMLIDKSKIKLVVIDVDNTLLDSQHKLSKRNEKAIKDALAQGTRVILATGKNYGACKSIIEQLGLKDPGIYTQGLCIHDANGTLQHQQTLDIEVVRKVITFAEDRGFAVVLYAQGRILARAKTTVIEELNTKWGDLPLEYVGPLQNILDTTKVNKVVAMSAYDDRKAKSLRWQLNAQINGNARLMNGGVDHMVEVLPPGGSKGTALKSLLKEMKIDPQQVIAIGDAENDIEMVKLAGLGVAMGNAQQILKDAADEITGSNDEDGVAQIIEKYVLPTPEPAKEEAKPEDTGTDKPEASAPKAEEKPEPDTAKPEDTTPKSSEG
jgi:hypothetical protein